MRAGLPEPEVNGVILNRMGVKLATGDLVYRRYRVLLEYDGGQHRTDEEQYHWDIDRLDDLMEDTWRVIRINKSHLRTRPAPVIRKVQTALRAAGWHPDPRLARAEKEWLLAVGRDPLGVERPAGDDAFGQSVQALHVRDIKADTRGRQVLVDPRNET